MVSIIEAKHELDKRVEEYKEKQVCKGERL